MLVNCSGPPSEFELSLLVTPPVRLSNVYKSRLTSGRFRTSFWLTVRESDADEVSTSGESPTTVSVSSTVPSAIDASTRALRPTSRAMPVCEKLLKPASATTTL